LTVLLNELWRKGTEDGEIYYCWGLSRGCLGSGNDKIVPFLKRTKRPTEHYDSVYKTKWAIRLAPSLLMEWDK